MQVGEVLRLLHAYHPQVGEVLEWLGLPVAAVPPPRGVLADTNLKYELEYCGQHLVSARQRQLHCVAGASV